jgi:glucose dehydrogenase
VYLRKTALSAAPNWYVQYTPGDMWDYDEAGTHILIDGEVAGQARKNQSAALTTAGGLRINSSSSSWSR